jgi:type VI secretion system secreted protein VgrG
VALEPGAAPSRPGSTTIFKAPKQQSLEERIMAMKGEERQVLLQCDALKGTLHELLFRSMQAKEGMNTLFEYKLELLSRSPNVPMEKVLGSYMTVSLEQPLPAKSPSERRYFHGYVAGFHFVGLEGEFSVYRAVLRPRLWLLTRNQDCRVWQDVSVPDVVQQILKDYHISIDQEHKQLTGEQFGGMYKAREYCVQYNETDFDFVSRLLEEEGIHYYFRHVDGEHKLVLADGIMAHEAVPGYKEVPFYQADRRTDRDVEAITSWSLYQNVQTGEAAVADFTYAPWPEPLIAVRTSEIKLGYDVPGEFARYHYPDLVAKWKEHDVSAARALAKLRAEEMHAEWELVVASTNARGIQVGATLSLTGHPRNDFGEHPYLVTATVFELNSGEYGSKGDANHKTTYSCRFTALNAQNAYRPQRVTKKPTITGPQNAIVTGPPGVEIYTDPNGLGRVLVQFPWDRYGKPEEANTSCWVRVSTPWAGSGFGGVQIPRVGEEVLVDFLDGDPDRPVIVGRLYNGKNKPPYKLPDNATQSGIKTHSSPKGHADNFNEIRFEDRKGKEELYVQAERDHTVLVKHDQSISVGANRSVSVGKNETIAIQYERRTTVTKKDEQFYLDTRSIEVKKTDTLDVVELRTENFHGGRKVTVEKDDSEYVKDATQTVTIDKQFNLSAKEHIGLTQGGNQMMVKDSVTIKSVGDIVLTNGGCTITMGKDGSMKLEGKAQVKLKSGAASITMTPDGSVTIDGPLGVKMQTGANSVALSPAGADVKGAVVNVTGIGNVTVMAPIIKVG